MPDNYEASLQEELWGCFRYIGIPYETLWRMPIQQRKFIIMKHNAEQEGIAKEAERARNGGNTSTVNGIGINEFAKMEQARQENALKNR